MIIAQESTQPNSVEIITKHRITYIDITTVPSKCCVYTNGNLVIVIDTPFRICYGNGVNGIAITEPKEQDNSYM